MGQITKEKQEGKIRIYDFKDYQFEEIQIEEKEPENYWAYLEDAIRIADIGTALLGLEEENIQPQIIRDAEFEEMK